MARFLGGDGAASMTHAQLEDRLGADAREMVRQFLQDHLDLRASRERRAEGVSGAGGVVHGAVGTGHERCLATVFGEVSVERLAYRHRGQANLHPADAALNLPGEVHSHGLRRIAAEESARGSFGEAAMAIERATGQHVAKRQVEQLARRSAADFGAFYELSRLAGAAAGDVLVLSADGKGVVTRPSDLRPATAAAATSKKLATRLSKGEKRNLERLAEVGAVYDAAPVPRQATDVMAGSGATGGAKAPAPVAKGKWLTASVVDDAAEVISQVFDEAGRRDPAHERTWVALVDGNKHQIARIKAEAKARDVKVTITCDFVHVLDVPCLHCTYVLPCWSFGPVSRQEPLLLLGVGDFWPLVTDAGIISGPSDTLPRAGFLSVPEAVPGVAERAGRVALLWGGAGATTVARRQHWLRWRRAGPRSLPIGSRRGRRPVGRGPCPTGRAPVPVAGALQWSFRVLSSVTCADLHTGQLGSQPKSCTR
jgi:hypothetical protein